MADTVNNLFKITVDVDITRPDEQFGDYSTNVALKLSGQLQRNPKDIAEEICQQLRVTLSESVESITVASNFINIRLKSPSILEAAKAATSYRPKTYEGKVIVAEYSDPNPFKVLHAGHLYTSIVGDGIASLMELAGGTVHRVNFGGDVGLHVAKTLWGILADYTNSTDSDVIGNAAGRALEALRGLGSKSLLDKANWLAEHYVSGTQLYDDGGEAVKLLINELNRQVYEFHSKNNHDSPLAQIYWMCRQWSYDYFQEFYKEIAVHPFERYYPESQTVEIGMATVREQLKKGVYEESDGAVVFKGEQYGLHTRVFINSAGLPTYETKDVGLIMLKWQDYHFDKSLIITSNDQGEYMKVVQKSIEQFEPQLAASSIHLTHGLVKLKGGDKMSSRKGNILKAADVLEITAKANTKLIGKENKLTTLGAIKYSFLKQRMGADIIYDPEESVSLAGNSGPYLQYAYARACSILGKVASTEGATVNDLEPAERSLARKISEYPETLDKAVTEYMPHHICTFLYELAQTFNSFYEHNRVIDDPRQVVRLQLLEIYAATLKSGLQVLNIPSPDHL